MTLVRVRVSFDVEVKVPDDWDDDLIRFDIEENHCPGTGRVGAALEDMVTRDDGEPMCVCWACPTGKNEIVEIVRAVAE